VHEPEPDSSSASARRTRAEAAAEGDLQPVGRALLSRSAESRDWADTGDPEYEPTLEGASAITSTPDGAEGDGTGSDDAEAGGSPGAPPQDPLPQDPLPQDPLPQDPSPGSDSDEHPGEHDTVMFARPDFTTAETTAQRASARQRLLEQVAASPVIGLVRLDDERGTSADPGGADAARGVPTAREDEPTGAVDGAPGVPAADPSPPMRKKRPRPAQRSPLLVQGMWPALLAVALGLASSLGVLPLAVVVLGVQVFLVLGALALLDAPAAGGAFFVATGAVLVGDAVVLLDDGSIARLGGVVGLGFVAALSHQLARRGRSRVTESLADTLVVIVVAVAAACLLALHEVNGGREVLQVSFAVAGAVLLVGRIGDRFVPQPVLAVGSTRGWPGLLMGLASGVLAAGVVAQLAGDPPLRSAVLLGLVIASVVATADLAVDLGAAELRSGWRDARRVAALRPTALLLPYAVLGPVALLAGRLLLT